MMRAERWLVLYAGVTTVTLTGVLLMGARSARSGTADFDRIRVHRIDIVEPDGTERLVIADRTAFPGSFLHGKELPRPDRADAAGLLLMNDEGTEEGGMIWGGQQSRAGGPTSFGHLSFDQYDQDQTLAMGSSLEADGRRRTSVQINDVGPWLMSPDFYRAAEEFKGMSHGPARAAAYAALNRKYPGAVQRAALTRSDDDSVGLELSDRTGQVRARLMVSADGEPRLEFLDKAGKVSRRWTAVQDGGK